MSNTTILDLASMAPEFNLKDHTGTERSLNEFKNSWVLVYFYPKDDTPGCTKEACAIRDFWSDFESNNIQVLGISADSPESHQKFKDKYNLPFPLLSDPEHTVLAMWGASKDPKNKKGIKRMSYLLDGQGVVRAVYPKVSPAAHAEEIIHDVKRLEESDN